MAMREYTNTIDVYLLNSNKMKRIISNSLLIIVACLLSVTVVIGQSVHEDDLDQVGEDEKVLQTEVVDGDTLPLVLLEPVAVVATKKRDHVAEYKFRRLKRNVTKVYPYAKEAARIIDEIDAVTSDIDKKRKQKKYVKQLEKDLKKNFEDELRNLTITQGKLLTKLVSRETGMTTHELIKDYKSGVTAVFWQTIGKRFGYDLKHQFDPINDKEDRDINEIVLSIESE